MYKIYLIYNGTVEVYTDKAAALEVSKKLFIDGIAFTLTENKEEAEALMPSGRFDE